VTNPRTSAIVGAISGVLLLLLALAIYLVLIRRRVSDVPSDPPEADPSCMELSVLYDEEDRYIFQENPLNFSEDLSEAGSPDSFDPGFDEDPLNELPRGHYSNVDVHQSDPESGSSNLEVRHTPVPKSRAKIPAC
jgi:hypothetical protein